MWLPLTCGDATVSGRLDLVMVMKRRSRFRSNVMDIPWRRIWGAMPILTARPPGSPRSSYEPEPLTLLSATNLDLRVEAAIGRSGESRGRAHAQERGDGAFAIDWSAVGSGLRRSILHGVTCSGAVSECDRVEDDLLRCVSNRRAWQSTARVVRYLIRSAKTGNQLQKFSWMLGNCWM